MTRQYDGVMNAGAGAFSASISPCCWKDCTSPAPVPAVPAYADASEKIVSRKPLGSLTSNARLFHSVSRGSDVSVMPAFFARFAISSTLPGVEIDKRTPLRFRRMRNTRSSSPHSQRQPRRAISML
jgi:hypothetical protein